MLRDCAIVVVILALAFYAYLIVAGITKLFMTNPHTLLANPVFVGMYVVVVFIGSLGINAVALLFDAAVFVATLIIAYERRVNIKMLIIIGVSIGLVGSAIAIAILAAFAGNLITKYPITTAAWAILFGNIFLVPVLFWVNARTGVAGGVRQLMAMAYASSVTYSYITDTATALMANHSAGVTGLVIGGLGLLDAVVVTPLLIVALTVAVKLLANCIVEVMRHAVVRHGV